MLSNPDVLIVGAGPTGLVIANELLRRNVSVRIVDKRESPAGTTRAFTVHARTFEMLEHMGLADRVRKVTAPCPGNRFHLHGVDLPEEQMPVLDFRKLENTHYNVYGKVNQQDLEQILRDHLASQHSVFPQWRTECVGLEQTDSGVEVKVAHPDDGRVEEIIRAKYVVGADGVHSIVRKTSGLSMDGEAYVENGDANFTMSMIDVPLHGYQGDDDWVNYYISQDNFLFITRLPDANHRVYISGEFEKHLKNDNEASHREAVQKALDYFVPGTKLGTIDHASTWTIYKMIASGYSKDRVFLCGDACHVRSPAGGQGMNCCVQDAFNLGWKLAAVVQGGANPAVLQTYELERRPIAQQVQAGADAMHHVIFDHEIPLAERMKATNDPKWHDDCTNRISGLSHNYRAVSTLPNNVSALEGGPVAGDRAPNAQLNSEPPQWLHEVYQHTGSTLVMLPANLQEMKTCREIAQAVSERYGANVKPVVIYSEPCVEFDRDHMFVDCDGEAAKWYGQGNEGRMYLVRPDLYIGCGALLSEFEGLQEYLSQWYMDIN